MCNTVSIGASQNFYGCDPGVCVCVCFFSSSLASLWAKTILPVHHLNAGRITANISN